MRDLVNDYRGIFKSRDLDAFQAILVDNPGLLPLVDINGQKALIHAIEEWPAAIPVQVAYDSGSADVSRYLRHGIHALWPVPSAENPAAPPAELMWAVVENDVPGVALALDSGADINQIDYEGWTPLHKAAFAGHTEIVRLLIERGADVAVAVRNGPHSACARRAANDTRRSTSAFGRRPSRFSRAGGIVA